MSASSRSRIVLPLVSVITAFALSAAYAEEPNPRVKGPPGGHPPAVAAHPPGHPPRPMAHPGPGGPHPGPAHFARGPLPSHRFDGHSYRGHLAWERGHWHHEMHNGRMGYWWDVGGVWYYYPQPMEGPPTYISEDFADDVPYADGGPDDVGPPPGPDAAYAPPPGAYPPPPPPPAPDPGASAVGGAIVGGLLGGLLTGRASGAAAGAIVGGATGAIAGATAASRPGYWMAQGNCYYRYPNGQYVAADPRWCY